ncbi:TonB-dependent siderophore receptor [Serratia marcescens]
MSEHPQNTANQPLRHPVAKLLLTSAMLLAPGAQAETDNVERDIAVVAGAQENVTAPLQGIVAKESAAGTKSAAPLVKTPQAITVVTRDQMDQQDAASVAQALRYSSGVVAEYRGTSNRSDEVIVRGFRYAPKYLDGLSYQSGQIDPWLLERVEVVRGPASVLYGQANPGGLVAMTSKRPVAQAIRKLQLSAGNLHQGEAAFDFGGALDEDAKLLYRLNGIAGTKETGIKDHKEKRFAIAPALTYIANEDTTFTLLTSYQKEPENGYRNFLPTSGVAIKSSAGYLPYDFNVSDPGFNQARREQTSFGYIFEHYINDVFSFQQNMRYTTVDERYKYLVFMSQAKNSTLLQRRPQKDIVKSHELVLDNQLKAQFSTGDVEHSVLTGLDYKWSKVNTQNWRGDSAGYFLDWTRPVYGMPVNESALPKVTDNRKVLDQLGVYLQDQMSYGGWNLLLSLRNDWTELRTQDMLRSSDSQQNDTKLTGRSGLLYAFDNGIAPYISYSTSFEPNLDTGAPGTDPFKPTTGEQTEIGVKFQPKNSNTLLTLALFDLTQKNVSSTNPVTKYKEQIGKVRSKGLEAEVHSQLTPAIALMAAYTYTDIVTKETYVDDQRGKTLVMVPTHAASAWGTYSFLQGPLKGFSTGAGVRYNGASQGNATNTYKVPAFTLYDWMARYELAEVAPSLAGAALQVNVNNLTDKHYVSSCGGVDACFYGSGRTVTATVSYSW